MGKDVDFVSGFGKVGGVLRNELFRAPVVHIFLSNDGDFHYRDGIRPAI
jgi:hypothetical protein